MRYNIVVQAEIIKSILVIIASGKINYVGGLEDIAL
jgi:hypothetical protein